MTVIRFLQRNPTGKNIAVVKVRILRTLSQKTLLSSPQNQKRNRTDPHQVDRKSEVLDETLLAFCCKVASKCYSTHHHGDEGCLKIVTHTNLVQFKINAL